MSQTDRVVFVVDDENIISDTLAMILKSAGYNAIAFSDPSEALASATAMNPSLLITDLLMPKMTGIELALRFRRALPDCKILLLSGHTDTSEMLERATKEGHEFDILAKPVHPAELLARLRA